MLIPTLHFQTYILKIPKTKTSLQFSLPSDPGAFPSICDEIYVDNVRLLPLFLSHAGICRAVGKSENPGGALCVQMDFTRQLKPTPSAAL